MADKIAEENTEATIIGIKEAGIGLEKACFPEVVIIIELGVQASNSRSKSGS